MRSSKNSLKLNTIKNQLIIFITGNPAETTKCTKKTNPKSKSMENKNPCPQKDIISPKHSRIVQGATSYKPAPRREI